MRSGRIIVPLIVMMILQMAYADAQVFRRSRTDKEATPKFVLVQLPTESRKIAWFNKNPKNASHAAQIAKDAQKMRQSMVNDLNDNFTFSPVYYYMDTNAALIKEKRFTGILLDKNMQVVSNATNVNLPYQIIIYGFAGATTSDYNAVGDEVKDAGYSVLRTRPRLIVYHANFDKILEPTPSGMDLSTRIARKFGKTQPKYMFNSSVQDMYYLPFAGQLSASMSEYYDTEKR